MLWVELYLSIYFIFFFVYIAEEQSINEEKHWIQLYLFRTELKEICIWTKLYIRVWENVHIYILF